MKQAKVNFYRRYGKRICDVICALAAMLVFCWLYAVILVLIRVKLGSPAIYKSQRIGKNGKAFTLYKFRTMTDERDKYGSLLPDEQRVVGLGRLLRSYSLDELPEAWNILRGELSVIGPRPLPPEYLRYYTELEKKRHDIKPGLSGLAQVNGRNKLRWEEKFEYDLEYVKTCCFTLDVKIVIQTLHRVVRRKDVVTGDTVTIGDYISKPLNIDRKTQVFDEIGSDFFEKLNTAQDVLSDSVSTFYLDSGRSAIRLALRSIKTSQKRAVLPAYTCEAVILPFIEAGYFVEYYSVDRNLLVNYEEFHSMIERLKPSVVLVHAYFGFDTIQNIREYLAQLANSGTIVIEDLTHGLFLKNRRPCSNFCIGSLRKWSGVPDGGFLTVCKGEFLIDPPGSESTKYLEIRSSAQELKREYTKTLDKETKEKYLSLFAESEIILNEQTEIYTMSSATRNSILSTDYESLKKRRQANCEYLLNSLSIIKEVIIPEQLNNQTDAPLYFVMYIDGNRTQLQKHMAERNIYLPVIWPMPPQVLGKCSGSVEYIYSKVLAIPCDQRYEISDMERISLAIKSYFSKGA
ncbi:MAG: sugar transferase [Oscillospiraceae bacterium]|nr:sugar transferase [Oscillospiraceae bacterium]